MTDLKTVFFNEILFTNKKIRKNIEDEWINVAKITNKEYFNQPYFCGINKKEKAYIIRPAAIVNLTITTDITNG